MAAFDSLLEGLRDNTVIKLRLPLDVHSDLPLLLEALRANTSVEEVNVDIYESFRHRPHAADGHRAKPAPGPSSATHDAPHDHRGS